MVFFHISFYRCGMYCTVHWAAQPVQFVDCVVEFMPPHFAGFSARFLCLGKKQDNPNRDFILCTEVTTSLKGLDHQMNILLKAY
jgi:hypothetical protein